MGLWGKLLCLFFLLSLAFPAFPCFSCLPWLSLLSLAFCLALLPFAFLDFSLLLLAFPFAFPCWPSLGCLFSLIFCAFLCFPLHCSLAGRVLGGSGKLLGILEGCIWPGASEASERSERAKLSGASSGFPWPITHALLCCCLVLFSACC